MEYQEFEPFSPPWIEALNDRDFVRQLHRFRHPKYVLLAHSTILEYFEQELLVRNARQLILGLPMLAKTRVET